MTVPTSHLIILCCFYIYIFSIYLKVNCFTCCMSRILNVVIFKLAPNVQESFFFSFFFCYSIGRVESVQKHATNLLMQFAVFLFFFFFVAVVVFLFFQIYRKPIFIYLMSYCCVFLFQPNLQCTPGNLNFSLDINIINVTLFYIFNWNNTTIYQFLWRVFTYSHSLSSSRVCFVMYLQHSQISIYMYKPYIDWNWIGAEKYYSCYYFFFSPRQSVCFVI